MSRTLSPESASHGSGPSSPGHRPHPPSGRRDKDNRPAERVHVSEAWPSLSKEINLTTREQIRAQDPVPEHIARRLVDSSDTHHARSGNEVEQDPKRPQYKGTLMMGRLTSSEGRHDPSSFGGSVSASMNVEGGMGNGRGPCPECARLQKLAKEASLKSSRGEGHMEMLEQRLRQAADKNEYMRGIIINYQKIIDDLRRSQNSHHKTLFETRKAASKAFKEQEMNIRQRVDAARREGELEAKLARDRELQAVALHAEESARMRQEADELKAEILRLKRIIENLEVQIPAKAEIESKASEEWQLRQRIKVQNNKIVELQAERDGLQTDRDEKLRSLKLLMDHKEAIEEQLETYKKRSNEFLSEIKDLQDEKERYVGLLNDVAAKQTDQGELIAELEYAAKAKDQALQGFRELAENWKFATTADMADATRQLLATEKSPRRLDPHSGARLGKGVRVNTDHGIEKPSHTFEATSKLIRTPDRSSYQISSSERRTSQSRENQEMLSNLFGVSDASKHLAKISEKEQQKRAKYNEATKVLNALNRQSEDTHNKLALQAMQDRATIHRDFASLMGPKLVAGGALARRSSDFQLSPENLPTLKAFGSSLSPGKAAAGQGTGSSSATNGHRHSQPSGGARRAHGKARFDGDDISISSSRSSKDNSTSRYSAAETPKRLRTREAAHSPMSPMSAWSPH